nr:hypothetical transcript [Hymenolepis microstoma]
MTVKKRYTKLSVQLFIAAVIALLLLSEGIYFAIKKCHELKETPCLTALSMIAIGAGICGIVALGVFIAVLCFKKSLPKLFFEEGASLVEKEFVDTNKNDHGDDLKGQGNRKSNVVSKIANDPRFQKRAVDYLNKAMKL